MTEALLHCPRSEDLSRECSAEEPSHALANHLLECKTCNDEWLAWHRLRRLARSLPLPTSSVEELEAVRASVICAVSQIPPQGLPTVARRERSASRAKRGILVVAAAAFTLVAIGAGRWSTHLRWIDAPPKHQDRAEAAPRNHHEIVSAGPRALFEEVSSPPDEMVRLRDGGITLDVSPLRTGERFRVIVGDAEIEVKGTEFQVIAQRDRLVSVRVFRGRVEVRPSGRPPQTLLPGEEWDAIAEMPEPAVPTLPPRHVVRRRPTSRPTAAEARPPETAEESFDEAWRLLRKSDFNAAISALDRTILLADNSPIAEDASFWNAVCHAKTHDDRRARMGFERFIQAFPSSPRAGEASAMLGWTLIRLGDLRAARARFSTAERDASARVRDSARLGMAAIEREVRASSTNVP